MRTTLKFYVEIRKLLKNGITLLSFFLKERLKLDISPEKSKIINLRKHESAFLGFTIRANRKGKKRVAHTFVRAEKIQKIKAETKKQSEILRSSPTIQNAIHFNSFVLGLHNYFNRATHVNLAFSRLCLRYWCNDLQSS